MDARRRVEQIIDEYWDSHPDMLFNALDREGLIEQGIPAPSNDNELEPVWEPKDGVEIRPTYDGHIAATFDGHTSTHSPQDARNVGLSFLAAAAEYLDR